MKLNKLFLALLFSLFSGLASAAPININTADPSTLEGLAGVGPKLAAAIVQDRKDKGPFKNVDDLARVPGVGKKVVERNRTNLVATP